MPFLLATRQIPPSVLEASWKASRPNPTATESGMPEGFETLHLEAGTETARAGATNEPRKGLKQNAAPL